MYDAHVAYHARTRPRAPAVITPRRRSTYAEFDADVNRYAAALLALGVTPERGVVGVDTPDPYRQAVLLVALARLGVAAGTARDGRCDLTISDRPGESSATALRLSRPWIAATEQAPPVEVASAERDPDGLARVMLSSGTAQAPRRVPISWRRMESGSLTVLAADAGGRIGVWVLRTGLDSGLGACLSAAAWTVGAAVALGFLAPLLPAFLERHPVGLIGMTPIQLRETLLALPAGFEVKPQWRVVVAGAALTPVVAREARRLLTPDILITYGTIETGRATVGPASRLETTPGAAGWPVPGATVQVVGPDGGLLADGEQGLIRIRGDCAIVGYLDDPEATAGAFRDGFFYPGDLGRRLPDGSFVIDGRIDERMNVGGIKVLPDLLENALLEHPQVRDCAAFATPGTDGGEECWMAVVSQGEVTRESLLAQLKRAGPQLPPIRFAWAEAIPRSEMGKIDRAALRTQTAAALAKA